MLRPSLDPIGVRRTRSVALPMASLLPCLGCATTNEADALRRLPPAPLVVAVDCAVAEEAPLTVRYGESDVGTTTEQLAELLAQELRALDASSLVMTRREIGDEAADVTVTFQPKGPITFSHDGTASYLAAGGLWIVTWIGGLLVPDSAYSVAMNANCRYAIDAGGSFDTPIHGDTVELAFFDRNDFLSGPTLQSLVLPPFWTSDQTDKTGAALTRSTMRSVARQITALLKNDFERRGGASGRWCAVELITPQNGQTPQSRSVPIELIATTRSSEPVSAVTASVNGGKAVPLTLGEPVPRGFRVTGTLDGLDPDSENWVRLTVSSDRDYTRTLRLGGGR